MTTKEYKGKEQKELIGHFFLVSNFPCYMLEDKGVRIDKDHSWDNTKGWTQVTYKAKIPYEFFQ